MSGFRTNGTGSSRRRPESTGAAHSGARKPLDRPRAFGIVEPCAQAFDLPTACGSFGTDQIVADAWTVLQTLAAIAGITAGAAIDQHVHLALGELGQPGGFQDAQPDRRVGGAEAVGTQAGEIEASIDAYGQDGGDPLRLESLGRVG